MWGIDFPQTQDFRVDASLHHRSLLRLELARGHRGYPGVMATPDHAPLEVVVLRGIDGYLAAVVMNGEWIGFYPAETRTAATAQAVLAITDALPS
jgi:hypothetical protein